MPCIVPWSMAVRRLAQPCRAAMPHSHAAQPCRAAMPRSHAAQQCRAAMPRSHAAQPCRAAMPRSHPMHYDVVHHLCASCHAVSPCAMPCALPCAILCAVLRAMPCSIAVHHAMQHRRAPCHAASPCTMPCSTAGLQAGPMSCMMAVLDTLHHGRAHTPWTSDFEICAVVISIVSRLASRIRRCWSSRDTIGTLTRHQNTCMRACSAVQCSAVRCGAVQCSAVQCV